MMQKAWKDNNTLTSLKNCLDTLKEFREEEYSLFVFENSSELHSFLSWSSWDSSSTEDLVVSRVYARDLEEAQAYFRRWFFEDGGEEDIDYDRSLDKAVLIIAAYDYGEGFEPLSVLDLSEKNRGWQNYSTYRI